MKINSKPNKVNKTIVAKLSNKKDAKNGVEASKDLPGTVEYFLTLPFDSATFYKSFRDYLQKQTDTNVIDLDSFINVVGNEKLNDIISIVVAAVEFVEVTPFCKKTKKNPKPEFVLIVKKNYEPIVKEAQTVANSMTLVRELQDTPSDVLYPEVFVERFKKEFKNVKGVKVTILNKKDLKAKKMGMILGVNKGSIHEAKMLVVEYLGNPKSKNRFAYVGKGITYDSGGMNLKPGQHMRTMKYDMSGAAIVSATVLAIAKNKLKTNVISVAPLTENLLSNQAQRPDDIVIAYNGKSVEIDNTDAEGRLVLGDAISYAAKDLRANRIFDVATLTGAMIYALGNTYTGVWATNDEHWEEFAKAGKCAGENLWRLPLHDDYLKMLDSKLADICNSVSRPEAGSSRAAMFLTQFREGVDLVHCDIAGTADTAGLGEGVLVRTLYNQAKLQK